MQPLSASECISPAIARTRLLLFTPFRKGRTWKLTATAYLCRLGTMFFPFPLIYLFFLPAAQSAGGILAASALVVGILLITALTAFVFYLCSRLQFAFFDIVLNRGQFVAPAWRKYGPQSLPWTGVKLLLGTCATLACALPIAAYVRHILPLMQALHTLQPGQPIPPQFFAVVFAGYGIIFLVFGPVFLVSSLLSDFLVPSLALEDAGLKESFRRILELIRLEPGEFALYTLLKIALAAATYIGATIAWEIVFIITTLILFLVAGLLGFLLHLVGVPTIVLTVLAIIIGVAWYIVGSGYSLLLTLGTVLTFLDAYALYFLGGRYKMLGDILEPPPVEWATPPPPPLASIDNPDDGPALPFNPAPV